MKANRQIERLIFEQLLLQAAIESEFAHLLAGREAAKPQLGAPDLQYLFNSTTQPLGGPIAPLRPVHSSR